MTAWRSAHLVLASILLASTCAGAAGAMTAQGPGALGEYIFGSGPQDDRSAPAPPVARYVSDQGQSFVLDRSSSTPLLKFEDSQEVLALTPSPASRGDVIYRDDLGEPVLRITRLGGLILFAPGRPGGAPVAFAGQASVLRLPTMPPSALLQHLAAASVHASRAARHLIAFDAQEVSPGSEAVFADAAAVASQAIARMAHRHDGAALIARTERVLFQPGPRDGVAVGRGVIVITVNPSQGLAGRPSSARIIEVAARGR
jgi:hypothetical protein